jgi:IS4 transposase
VALDLAKIEKQMRESRINNREFLVCLGNDEKVKCRLIVECLPEEVKAEKLRKANRSAQREGRQLGKDTIARIGLNLFVTNMPEQDIPKELVWSLYRLRWQIELVFKVWKSIASVDKIKKAKRARIECHLYGKLLWVFLGWNIYWKITNQIHDRTKAVSFNKMMKNLRKFCNHLKSHELIKIDGVGPSIQKFVENVLKNCMLEKRKGNISSTDIIIRLTAI